MAYLLQYLRPPLHKHLLNHSLNSEKNTERDDDNCWPLLALLKTQAHSSNLFSNSCMPFFHFFFFYLPISLFGNLTMEFVIRSRKLFL